ncbi:MAG: alpha/beta hydrolase [Rhodanobacteraceae bacterium]
MTKHIVPVVFAVVLALATGSAFAMDHARPSVVTDMAYITPARLVDIGGRRVNIYCVGHGSPTVVFDAGLGDQIRAWAIVQPAVSKVTRACSYDRAGLGFSDPSGRPGTAANAVDDLRRLLVAASVKPPYVLVGHSLGGMYMQLFADLHRSEVAGMVLVDPVSDEQGRRYNALDPTMTKENATFVASLRTRCIPAARKDYVGEPKLFERCVGKPDPHFSKAFNRAFLANHSTVKYMQAAWLEWTNVFSVSADQALAARCSYGDMPLIVLSRAPFPLLPHETQAMRDAKNYLWVELHDDIASVSTRGVNEIVPGAGHYIQFDKPQTVIDAIGHVVWETRQTKDTQMPAVLASAKLCGSGSG